jgi:hypothetical protein
MIGTRTIKRDVLTVAVQIIRKMIADTLIRKKQPKIFWLNIPRRNQEKQS